MVMKVKRSDNVVDIEDCPRHVRAEIAAQVVSSRLESKELAGIPSFTDDETHFLDAFPAPIRLATKEIAQSLCLPDDIVAGLFLHLGSTCIGCSRSIQTRAKWRQHANLYMLFVAPPASRKSKALEYIQKFVDDNEATHKEFFFEQMREYQELCKDWEKMSLKERKAILETQKSMNENHPDKYKFPPRRPANIQYTLKNSTLEAAIERNSDNPSGLQWVADEFANFINRLDRYTKNGGGEGVSALCEAYEGGKLSTTRKSKDGRIDEVYERFSLWGLTGNLQPKLLPKQFSELVEAQGLPSRFAYVYPQPVPSRLGGNGISDETEKLLEVLTREMLAMRVYKDMDGKTNFPAPYRIDPEGEAEFIRVYNSIMEQTENTLYDIYAMRALGRVLRIALILHIYKIVLQQVTIKDTTNERSSLHSDCTTVSISTEKMIPEFNREVVSAQTMHEAIIIANWLAGFTSQVLPEMFPKVFGNTKENNDMRTRNLRRFFDFVNKNQDFCNQEHRLQEILAWGYEFETEKDVNQYQAIGHFFKQLGIPKKTTRQGVKYILGNFTTCSE